MDEKDKKDVSSEEKAEQVNEGFDESGEYHFVRPEQKLYEDAGFVPCDEDTDIPKRYVPTAKKVKDLDGGKGFFKLTCLCLACALIGGLIGGFIVSKVNPQEDTPDVVSSEKPISTTKSENEAKTISSANDIYSLGCQQAVGITTEVTTTNWFGQTSSSAVSGSGFVVTEDGYIITNFHVIEYAYLYNYDVSVMFYDGETYKASIVGVEEDNDIAVLKIDAEGLSPVDIGDSDAITVGESVYAIGNPLGELAFSMTTGNVSALDRSIATSEGTTAISMFQFDAAVNSGNSGGPLYNSSGEVIGIVTAKYSSTGVEGLSFAIPINDAVDIANDLITKGYVSGKAYLGANIDSRYTSVYAEYYSMPEGAYVFSVESDSCAEDCGLAAGDIITKLGDDEIKSLTDLDSALRHYHAGETADISVYRSGEYLILSVTFDEAKPSADSNEKPSSSVQSAA